MKVSKIMRKDVVDVDVNETVIDAVERMSGKNVDSLIATDSQKPVGIVTGNDLAIGCLGAAHQPWECSVFRHISIPLISVDPDTEAVSALKLMVEKEIRHLGVVDNGELVGIVAMSDIVKIALQNGSSII